ncbi:MAG: metallophosphoesterase [Candidatus Moranbacteria bacterium]|nr:metallophosphoesterase [Candidatus Moranbacteria bacterium]
MLKTKTKIIITLFALTASFALFSFARAEILKVGFVTDWEYGTKKEYDHKLPKKAESYLKTAVNHYNKIFQPDLVVGGGDYILSRGVSKKKAAKQLRHINNIFRKASAPRRYCIGNHDLSHMSEKAVEENLGINSAHSSTDLNGVRVITLDTNDPLSKEGDEEYGMTGKVSDEELVWLDEQLNTNLPVVVFSHHSPVQTLDGKVSRINIYSADHVRAVLEKYDNVVAVFSGHHAVNYSTEVNGINYVIINNLTDKKAKGTFADITAEKNGNNVSVSVSQFGKRPATYNFSKTLSSD